MVSAIASGWSLGLAIAQYGILALSYLGLALGYVPGFRMNRATIALTSSAFLIGLGVLPLQEAWQSIDATTLVFLLSTMVLNANLAYAGFFQVVLASLLRVTRSPFGVLVVLTFGSGLLSALFLNDTLAILCTPLVLALTQTLRLPPVPYLLALAASTNVGSVATLSGNPQNILVGSFSQIGYVPFAQALGPVAVAGLTVQVGLLGWLYPAVRSLQPQPGEVALQPRVFRPLLVKSLWVTAGLLLAFVVGAPLANSAFVAAAILLITRRIKPQRILREVDWNLLVLFSGLFILSRCTQVLDLLTPFQQWVATPWGLCGVTTVLSNVISNVPAVLLIQPLIPREETQSWLLLAASSTLAGNLTLFGAIANLIVVEAAEKLGHRLSFWEHFRFGLPLTAITLAIAYAWIVWVL
ncbi:anion transporter [Geitlerinema sp. PCC 7407]|uniref:anion transporter n=1 Tax=Geitlerinema sp. PCC 7407 TaxID=1173025 RepID=UPI00029FBD43|nr:anion transporter [Geitlerinema sp. PCC 7407]AFY65508.1 transporter, YbiR family [Geitlerinema sp. PCC 7407]